MALMKKLNMKLLFVVYFLFFKNLLIFKISLSFYYNLNSIKYKVKQNFLIKKVGHQRDSVYVGYDYQYLSY